MSIVSQDEYDKLCERHDFFKNIGYDGFETKIWLLFKALTDDTVSKKSVAKNPCQSLMQHNVPFSMIEYYLEELNNRGFLEKHTGGNYALKDDRSYELHQISFEITSKLTRTNYPLDRLIQECGYVLDRRNQTLIEKFTSGDINDKENTFTDWMTQLAYSGAKLLTKVVVDIADNF